jgi:tetratricopeptide (TPR) repeat protein
MKPNEIEGLFKKNQDEQIAKTFGYLSLLVLTLDQGAMVAWAHHNALNRNKDLKPIEIERERKDIIDMARYVLRRSKDNVQKSSMIKLIALTKDSLGEREIALEYIDQAIDFDADNADNYSAHGLMLLRAKRFAEAEDQLTVAISLTERQIKPDDPERFKYQRFMGNALRNMAICLKELGDLDSAITMTHTAESAWLASEEGGWSTESHRKGIISMRAKWIGEKK